MAERRMVSITLVDDDRFLDMSQGAQLLYFHFSMRADDDGFFASRKIIRTVDSKQSYLDELVSKGYIILFPSGVGCIVHWFSNNTIQKDRYKESQFEERDLVELTTLNGRKEYRLKDASGSDTECIQNGDASDAECEQDGNDVDAECIQTVSNLDADCIQNVSKVFPQVRLGKDREREKTPSLRESESKRETPSPVSRSDPAHAAWFNPPTLEEVRAYFGGNCLKGNPDDFWSNYQAVGWVDGLGRKITDWKAAARKWSGRESLRASPGSPGGGRPRDYDGSYDGHAMKEVSI